MKKSMETKNDLSVVDLRHFVSLVRREIYWCDKACGCGECHLQFIAQYDVTDAGAVLK